MLDARSVVSRSEVLAAELAGSTFPVVELKGDESRGEQLPEAVRRAARRARAADVVLLTARGHGKVLGSLTLFHSRRAFAPGDMVAARFAASHLGLVLRAFLDTNGAAAADRASFARALSLSQATRSPWASKGPKLRTKSCASPPAPRVRRRLSSGIRASRSPGAARFGGADRRTPPTGAAGRPSPSASRCGSSPTATGTAAQWRASPSASRRWAFSSSPFRQGRAPRRQRSTDSPRSPCGRPRPCAPASAPRRCHSSSSARRRCWPWSARRPPSSRLRTRSRPPSRGFPSSCARSA